VGGIPGPIRWSRIAVGVLLALAAMLLPAGPASAATLHVNCATEDLQPRIDAAAPSSTLLIKGTCYGNFTVDKELTLQGDPTATLDGNSAGDTVTVSSLDRVRLSRLVITGGTSGIVHTNGMSAAGLLVLNGVTVTDNTNSLIALSAVGGGIFSRGSLRITGSSIVHNQLVVTNFSDDAHAEGGGIYSEGPLTLINSAVRSNRAAARATAAGKEAEARGGGIAVVGGSLTVERSHIDGNRAVAHSSNGPAFGIGGGIEIDPGSASVSVSITNSTLNENAAGASGTTANAAGGGFAGSLVDEVTVGGSTALRNELSASSPSGPATVLGGAFDVLGDSLVVRSSAIGGSKMSVPSALQAQARGSGIDMFGQASITGSSVTGGRIAIHSSSFATVTGGAVAQLANGKPLTVTRSTVSGNAMVLRSDSSTARGFGGGVYSAGRLTVAASTVSGNSISSTAGPTSPADAFGGGLLLAQGAGHVVRNSTIAGNAARAFAPGGTATATGGGIEFDADATNLVNATVARNVVGGSGGVNSQHGGGLNVEGGPVTLKGTIVALDTSSAAGPDCSGDVASAGHNLVGKTAGCTFAHLASDKRNVNPKLGSLADNGGPTKTLALKVGSPAINAIPAAACAVSTDQRGVHRPQGPRCDIGAYERKL
jgi:hypothetical protein